MRRLLPFLPSLVLGLAGAVWVWLVPPPYLRPGDPVRTLIWGAVTGGALLAAGQLLERLPSFRQGSRLTETLLRRLRISRAEGLLLAAATAVGEELLFRGGLLPLVGVWLQALLFGALHPVSVRAWAYTAFTAVAGLIFGFLAVATGSLAAPMVAHFIVNLHGFWSLRPPRRDGNRRSSSTTAAPSRSRGTPGGRAKSVELETPGLLLRTRSIALRRFLP